MKLTVPILQKPKSSSATLRRAIIVIEGNVIAIDLQSFPIESLVIECKDGRRFAALEESGTTWLLEVEDKLRYRKSDVRASELLADGVKSIKNKSRNSTEGMRPLKSYLARRNYEISLLSG